MSVLDRKVWRDLRAQPGPSLAVTTVMALGVMLFVSSAGAYRNLRDSYAATRQQLALAGLHVDLAAPLGEADLAQVRALPQVQRAETRLLAELPVSPVKGRRAALRVLSLPDDGEPQLDKVWVLEGALPKDGEVLLEKHFARHHQLTAGASLPVGASGEVLRVSGVAVAAEYLWVARDQNDFFTSPDEFGVGWMRRTALVTAAAAEPGRSQLLVDPRPDTGAAALIPAVRALLGPQVQRALPSAELVGVKLLQLDVDGYKGMAAFFPVFFLGVGAFIMGSVLARLVDAQRPLIGTFLALGVARGAVLRHYVGTALVLGGTGSLIGAVLGLAIAPEMTKAYAAELNIPFVQAGLHADLLGSGVAMGLVVALVAGLLPAVRAMRLVPAEAMRPPRPSVSALSRRLRTLRVPLPVRLAVRDIFDRPLRSLGTALGVAAAVVLVLSTGVLMDSMRTTFDALFTQAIRYDARVDFAAPGPASALLATARGVPGVERAEALLVAPVRLDAHGAHLDALLQALADDAQLLQSVDADGTAVNPAAGGLVLTRSAAKTLRLTLGDSLKVTPLAGGEGLTLKLTGYGDAAMGNTASARRADVETPWRLAGLATGVVASTSGDRAAVRAALVSAFPQAVRVEDTAATRALFAQLMGLGWLMIGLMLAFGGVLAGAILFNTATLLVLERQRELATLRALGLRMREVAVMLTTQHALLALLGLGLGLPLAVGAAQLMLGAFSSELFALPFVLRAPTVLVTLAGVFGVVLLAQGPALRKVSRASLADAVRERS